MLPKKEVCRQGNIFTRFIRLVVDEILRGAEKYFLVTVIHFISSALPIKMSKP